jgi:hypothetical protein
VRTAGAKRIAAQEPERLVAASLIEQAYGVDRKARLGNGSDHPAEEWQEAIVLVLRQAGRQGHVEAECLHHVGVSPTQKQSFLQGAERSLAPTHQLLFRRRTAKIVEVAYASRREVP